MDWDEEPRDHGNDPDNHRPPPSNSAPLPSFSTPDWETFAEGTESEYSKRLDYLLPIDGETGVATHEAACTYMDAMIEMVARQGYPLSLLSIAVDESTVLRFLGGEGAALIGRAAARCLRQETRTHDVVGHADPGISPDAYTFLIICPLLNEEHAANLGERLRAAMTAHSGDAESPWLTLSVGVAALSIEVTDSQSLVARSMEALRRARRSGGSRVWKHTDTRRVIIENEDRDSRNDKAENPDYNSNQNADHNANQNTNQNLDQNADPLAGQDEVGGD